MAKNARGFTPLDVAEKVENVEVAAAVQRAAAGRVDPAAEGARVDYASEKREKLAAYLADAAKGLPSMFPAAAVEAKKDQPPQ